MSHDVSIPSQLQNIVSERTAIWNDLDEATTRASDLNKYSQEIGGLSGEATPVQSPFSTGDNPAQEVFAVLNEISLQIDSISKAEDEISTSRARIEEIKKRVRNIYFALGGGAVAIVIVLLLVVSG